ncbi:hypothetical protein [Pseudoalteromonas sp. T1lg23B]|uniref:hypothetical protein n=1 Tax=Pseudoalteromonas sp. T1lg23B TaxID=2077097 RepID=UPI000CF5F72D|nr:hypothetical protein [Pseudoalteromonas sp. T1lg23B]
MKHDKLLEKTEHLNACQAEYLVSLKQFIAALEVSEESHPLLEFYKKTLMLGEQELDFLNSISVSKMRFLPPLIKINSKMLRLSADRLESEGMNESELTNIFNLMSVHQK